MLTPKEVIENFNAQYVEGLECGCKFTLHHLVYVRRGRYRACLEEGQAVATWSRKEVDSALALRNLQLVDARREHEVTRNQSGSAIGTSDTDTDGTIPTGGKYQGEIPLVVIPDLQGTDPSFNR